jgi:hypothetical protein
MAGALRPPAKAGGKAPLDKQVFFVLHFPLNPHLFGLLGIVASSRHRARRLPVWLQPALLTDALEWID